MAKLESSLKNMVLSLGIITVVAAGLLAGAFLLTKDTIDATNKKNIAEAKTAVLPAIEGLDVDQEGVAHDGIIIYKARVGAEEVGAAVEVIGSGFGGDFKLMVGFDREGNVTGFKVLSHQETPGLGAKMEQWFSADKGNQLLAGHNPAKLEVMKKGATVSEGMEPLDAITAATISSRAFLAAVQAAYEAYVATATDALSGATEKHACQHHCGGCCHEAAAEGACCGHCEGALEHACQHACGGCEHKDAPCCHGAE